MRLRRTAIGPYQGAYTLFQNAITEAIGIIEEIIMEPYDGPRGDRYNSGIVLNALVDLDRRVNYLTNTYERENDNIWLYFKNKIEYFVDQYVPYFRTMLPESDFTIPQTPNLQANVLKMIPSIIGTRFN